MSEPATEFGISLTTGQLNLIARSYGVSSHRPFLDIGCGDGSWLRNLRQRGANIRGMEERTSSGTVSDEAVSLGSPAAAAPWAVHSVDTILFRGTRILAAAPFSPDVMIALANLCSTLKPQRKLLIPVDSVSSPVIEHWQKQLSVFPGSVRIRTITSGLRGILTLAFLFGWTYQVNLVEFTAPKKQLSRKEWHRVAREAVMSRMQPPAAA